MKANSTFKILIAVAVLAATGCGGDQPKPVKATAAADRLAFPKQPITFGEGFYGEETFKDGSGAIHTFHWMQGGGAADLPAWKGGAILRFSLHVPAELLKPPPHITIAVNGQTIDSFDATKDVYERAYPIEAADLHPDALNKLSFKTTRTLTPSLTNPNADTRTFGLQVTDLRLESVNP